MAPWDNRYAMRSYCTLFGNSDEPEFFLRSLERSREVRRIECKPWYNFTYGAITGNDCEQEESIKTLREWP